MKRFIISLALCLILTNLNGQVPEMPTPAPFRLEVSVAYANAEKFPQLASYVYKKVREIPGVVIVPEKDAYVSVVISDVGANKVYSCACVVMESANRDINGALIMVQRAPLTGDKNTDAWQDDVRVSFGKVQPVFRLKESWMVMTATPQAGINQVIDNFNVRYVEKIRREWEAPIPNLDDDPPAGGWKYEKPLHVLDWMSKYCR